MAFATIYHIYMSTRLIHYLSYLLNLPCPREQPEQVLMATQSMRSKFTKVVLDTISSHLLGVLIPADIHRLPCDLEGGKKREEK